MDGVTPEPFAGGAAASPLPGMPRPLPTAVLPQRLDAFDPTQRRRLARPAAASRTLPRLVVFGLTLAITAFGGYQMSRALSLGGVTGLTLLVLALFVLNFAWIAFAFVNALVGTVLTLARRRPQVTADPAPIGGRTAVLMPIYNERPERCYAAVEAMARGLEALGHSHAFDWFILSDTTDATIAAAEQSAFIGLRNGLAPGTRAYYRRRRRNTHRKSGNIADFCRRWGGGYDYLLVLDADSLMAPATIVELARRMEADPDLGILQTVPELVNARTTLGRLQQFANRVYGPLLARGLAWWTQSEGNYWGHNAIIRRRAFTRAAGLPVLSGRPPFGGHILSHDFVEAALIRRAGYTVRIAADLSGSYEEGPTSLIDLATRDRRWCQGNLQHVRIVGARGLHWVSRFHLMNGIMSYGASLLWLLLIGAGLALSLEVQYVRPEYFPNAVGLPVLPIVDPQRALAVLALTAGVLFGPKLMGGVALACDREARRASGGAGRLTASVLFETLAAALMAPVAMLMQSRMIVSIVLGHDAGWLPQRREDGSRSWGDLLHFHWPHVACGGVLGGLAWAVSPAALLWLSPAVAGMIAAPVISALSGSARFGHTIRRLGLLRTPQETARPVITRKALTVRRSHRMAVAATPDFPSLIIDVGRRRDLLALADRPDRRRGEVDPVEATATVKIGQARTLAEALSYLDADERAITLATPELMEQLAALPTEQTAA